MRMRYCFAGSLAICLAAAQADDKPDPKLLTGAWKTKDASMLVLEFDKGGAIKYWRVLSEGRNRLEVSGKYTVERNKIHVDLGEKKGVFTIKRLTKEELEMVDPGGITVTL